MMEFLQFYWDVFWRVPALFVSSVVTIQGVVGMLLFIGAPIVGAEAANRWTDLHVNRGKFALYAIGVYFCFLLLQSNYSAFKTLTADNDKAVAALDDKLDKVIRDSDTKTLLMDHLTTENAALMAGGRVLTDSQARIEAIRKEFLDHVSKSPTKEAFTSELGHEWYVEAYAMKEQTLADETDLYFMSFEVNAANRDDYKNFLVTVGGFRSIAVNLTEGDLKDNTPSRNN